MSIEETLDNPLRYRRENVDADELPDAEDLRRGGFDSLGECFGAVMNAADDMEQGLICGACDGTGYVAAGGAVDRSGIMTHEAAEQLLASIAGTHWQIKITGPDGLLALDGCKWRQVTPDYLERAIEAGGFEELECEPAAGMDTLKVRVAELQKHESELETIRKAQSARIAELEQQLKELQTTPIGTAVGLAKKLESRVKSLTSDSNAYYRNYTEQFNLREKSEAKVAELEQRLAKQVEENAKEYQRGRDNEVEAQTTANRWRSAEEVVKLRDKITRLNQQLEHIRSSF